jgi:hypothetical protein
MRRRQALLALAGLTVCGGLTVVGVAPGASEAAGVVAIIFKRLGYLELDRQGVLQFARDYTTRHLMSARKLSALSAAKPLYDRVPQSWFDRLTPDIPYGEEKVVTAFLLSSDFFPAADERRAVRYRGFFDAQRQGSPFARLRTQKG